MSRIYLTVVACAGLVLASLPARAELPPLIPRKVLFGNPVKASPQLSPDGKRLAYLAPDKKDVLQVWVQTVGKDDAKQVTKDRKRGIRIHLWTYAPDTLLYMQDSEGDENFHIFSVNLKDGNVRDLTPFQGVRAGPLGVNRDHPNELLATMNVRNRRVFDVYRIDLTTGATVLDTANPGSATSWDVDNNFQVRIMSLPTPDGGTEMRHRPDKKTPFKTLLKWGLDDTNGYVLGFTKDNKSIYLATSKGRDTQSLVKMNLDTGEEKLIATNPRADFAGAMIDPNTHEVLAASFNRERVKWRALDKGVEADLAVLQKGAPGEPSVVSSDRAYKTWVVAYSGDVVPAAYYLYDRSSKELKKLFVARPALAKYTLAPMRPVTIKSRDGLELVSYLTLPVGVKAEKLPMVLLVHGGPWRDSWGFGSLSQLLANRGYAVLQVNYRGSTGFGKKFLNAGNREWAAKMHDDLIDAVDWAIKQKIADPKKVAIMGGSYGGYAALVGVTFTPDKFCCGISIVGPSNLVTLLKSIPPYWEPLKNQFMIRMGEGEDFLKSRSPLFKADRIKVPVLIAQGANDPRVKQAESEQIVSAMRKAGKPVEYMLFADEGHGFARPENMLKFMAAAEAFLAKHVGGRVEAAEPAPATPR